MLDRYGGLIWLAVFVATYGGIYALLARDERRSRGRALRERYAGVDNGEGRTSPWEVTMATEPTLGARIMGAAVGLSCAGNRATVDRSMAKLRALAARADAAERLARCCHELNNIDFDDYLEALAAWRAIEGNEVPQ